MSEDVKAHDARSSTSEVEHSSPDPRRWRILGVSLVVGFMALLDVSIVNVAIPSMQTGLHTSAGAIQWVVSGYALTFGLTLVAGGRLGDAFGRRRMMLFGLIGFVLTSAAVGLAPNVGLVIVARLLQGAVAGFLTPQNSAIIQQLFRGAERARAFGVFGFTVSVSSAIGPVLGGLIIAAAGPESGWRWLFLVNIPIGLLALAGVVFVVPKRSDPASSSDARIDVIGAVLLGAAVICLLYPVVSVEGGNKLPLVLLVGVPVFAWAFLRWERRLLEHTQMPLLDVGLLQRLPGYLGGILVGSLYFVGFTGILLVLSVHFQEALNFSPLHAGLLVMPFAVGSAVSAPIAGRLVSHVGRKLTVIALCVMVVGVALIALLVAGQSAERLAWVSVPVLFLTGLGGGAVVSPNITLTLADVPPKMGGAAGGALQTGQRIGAAIGAALLVTVYTTLRSSGQDAGLALRLAVLTGFVLLLVALAMAVRSLRVSGDAELEAVDRPPPD